MRLHIQAKLETGTSLTSQGVLTRRQEVKLLILGRDKPPFTVILVNTWINANRRQLCGGW